MSTYQFFIILHGLKDVLVWLIPLVVAIILCLTALAISARWFKERRSSANGVSGLAARVEEIESRLTAIERREAIGSNPETQAPSRESESGQ